MPDAINDSHILKDNIELATITDGMKYIPDTSRQIMVYEAIDSHCSSPSIISKPANPITKTKSNSPPEDTHINTGKNNKPTFVNLDNVNRSDYIVTSKSCNSHLSTKQGKLVEETVETIQPDISQNQNIGNGDTTCERKITPSRQALRHAVHNLYLSLIHI